MRRALDRSHLAPSRLQLEITDSTPVDNHDDVADALRTIRDLGVRVALDDFGVRHTSLEQLRVLPVDVVKFDRTFVTSSLTDGSNVLRGIIEFAHELGLDTVGKGIETVEQLAGLGAIGCRYAQGYLIAHPLLPADVQVFLDERAELHNTAAGMLSPIS